MSHFFKNIALWAVLLISFLYAYKSFAAGGDPQIASTLTKVYHHTNGPALSNAYLEMGTVIFYFSKKVLPTLLKKQLLSNGLQEYQFFFKEVGISDPAVYSMMDRIQLEKNHYYTLKLQPVVKPFKGILFTLIYDPDQVAFSYDALTSIGAQPGIVFRFINKKLQEEMAQTVQNRRMTCVAWMHNKPRIIIDAGHGGDDNGAVGVNGLKEKDLCLFLSKKVAHHLNEWGYDTHFTRAQDTTVLLDERSKRANALQGDFFISIHANAAFNTNAHGIETFYTGFSSIQPLFSTLKPEARVLVNNYYQEQEKKSKNFAKAVHAQLSNVISPLHSKPLNRGLKKATSQVLLGTRMPSILVEVGFVTNQMEASLLASEHYQKMLALAIAKGIQNHIINASFC